MPLPRLILFSLSGLAVILLIGFAAAAYPPFLLIGSVLTVVVFGLTFLNTEVGLYILIFSMLLSPEIGVSGLGGGAALERGLTIRLDDLLLVVIGFSWFTKTAVYKDLGLFLKTKLNRPIFYYMVACLVPTGIGILAGRVDPKTGFFFVLKYFEYFIVFFMVANHVENESQLKRILFCLFLTCFITCFVGMAQIPAGGRVSAPFEGEQGEPNTFGGYLVLIGAVAGGILSSAKDRRTRWLLIVLIVAIIPPLLFTRSRSSYLAALTAFFLIGWFSEKRRFVLPLMVAALIVGTLFLPPTVKERILYTVSQPFHEQQIQVGGVRLDTSLSARLKSWQEGIQDWTRHPLLGYGVTGYAFLDAQYVRVLLESGVFGLAAFGYLLFAVFRLVRSVWDQVSDPLHRGLVSGFLAGYLGLLFHALGANTFIIVRIMEPFWFVVGLITVLPALEGARQAIPEKGGSHNRRGEAGPAVIRREGLTVFLR
jgi:O-antigen ligase